MEDDIQQPQLDYTWTIFSLETKTYKGMPDVVCKVIWQVEGRLTENDVEYSGVFRTSTELYLPYVGYELFVAFPEITENNIIDWIKRKVSVITYQEHILKEIEKVKENRRIITSDQLPWK
jgi:hypothetical protein